MSPVAAACPPEATIRENDSVGIEDRCLSRAKPVCKPELELRIDVKGHGDRCVAAGVSEPGEASKPTCPPGLELKERDGEDACERSEQPRCSPGFKLKPMKAEDMCVP